MMRRILLLSVFCMLGVDAIQSFAAAPEFHIAEQTILPGAVKWDYLSFDSDAKRLFITHGDQVDIYDPTRKNVTNSIKGTSGVHGVALASALGKGFTTNGRANTVTVFDLKTLKILATLATEDKPDAISYDPYTQRVFVANGGSGSLTVIDAKTNLVLGTVVIGGRLEFAVVDGKGHLFINVEDQNAVAVVDTVALTLVARYDLASVCGEPAALAIDTLSDRLFVGCGNKKMVTVDAKTGAILADVGIGKGCDAVAFDSQLKLLFSSNGEGTLTVISTENYAVIQTLKTKLTARTLALDEGSHRLYTVAADILETRGEGNRPTLKPGSFTLLTIERSVAH